MAKRQPIIVRRTVSVGAWRAERPRGPNQAGWVRNSVLNVLPALDVF